LRPAGRIKRVLLLRQGGNTLRADGLPRSEPGAQEALLLAGAHQFGRPRSAG